MRIGLTYNLKPAGAVGDEFEEFDSEETIEGLETALRACGHEPVRFGWGMEMLDALDRGRVDGVFNIAEGVGGRGRESQVPAMLEMLGIPCSGSDALSIALTLDKSLAKLLARSHGIPTAPWRVVRNDDKATTALAMGLRFPLFVKPSGEGSSMGITQRSLCHNEEHLQATIAQLTGRYGPALVEEFLPGDEFTVGLIEGKVIGVMQVLPRAADEQFVYSLEVKRDYLNRVDYRLVDAPDVAAVAQAVWSAFGLRDVARVDVRRDRVGVASFVEVNPLPGVHPINSDLVILARLLGWSHEALISKIIGAATKRWASEATPVRAMKPSPALPLGGSNMRARIAVCYNDDAHLKTHLNETEMLGESEVVATATEVAALLKADAVPVGEDVVAALRSLSRYETVVNLCEGVLGRPQFEKNFALALEMLQVPNTGCDPVATGICSDKILAKRLLEGAGIPVPGAWDGSEGTWIVKPSREDAGIGIEAASVVSSAAEVAERIALVEARYGQPAVAEAFIDGRELNQAIYFSVNGAVVLPLGEIVFDEALSARERVVGWKAKWDAGSDEDRATRNRTPALVDEAARGRIAALSLSAASLLSIGGYCRLDLRESSDGRLWILDLNPNPDIGSGSGFRLALEAAGIPFVDFLNALIMSAAARRRKP